MPYHIEKWGNGYRLVLNHNPSYFFSKHPMSKEKVIKQLHAILMNEHNKGGLIGVIPEEQIIKTKKNYEYPDRTNLLVDFLKMKENKNINKSDIIIFGSYNLKIQPYYADIDSINKVHINANDKDTSIILCKEFQKIVNNIEKKKGWFFTDAKAGTYEDGESIHWTAKEIRQGFRNGNKPDFNGHLGNKTLVDAVSEQALLKIDMIVPYYDKYIEVTCVYLVTNNEGCFNYSKNFVLAGYALESLLKDTFKQYEKGKFFKVIKRCFALLRYSKNKKLIDLTVPLLASNVSKLSSIVSYLDSIRLLLKLNKPVNIIFIGSEFGSFTNVLSNIQDIDIDDKSLIEELKKIYLLIKQNKYNDAIKILDYIIDYLTNINNDEVKEYFQSKHTNLNYYLNEVKKVTLEFIKYNGNLPIF